MIYNLILFDNCEYVFKKTIKIRTTTPSSWPQGVVSSKWVFYDIFLPLKLIEETAFSNSRITIYSGKLTDQMKISLGDFQKTKVKQWEASNK